MLSNPYEEDPHSIFIFRNPFRFLTRKGREIGIYLSGALFAIGWWLFVDAVINSSKNVGEVKMGFEDWFSGLLTTMGMIIVNLIDKRRLYDEDQYTEPGMQWKARLFLFFGFALLAGGLAGSCCVLIIKYVVHLESAEPYLQYGILGVGQSGLIMLSTIILWIAQNTKAEYDYELHI
ncbi:hypothetical protein BDB01DRAFT_786375 [Pilobolus umbonatus]|nr:hypothetical protein BDB01DRAFT_786375 [Pilobolus umbonatus]